MTDIDDRDRPVLSVLPGGSTEERVEHVHARSQARNTRPPYAGYAYPNNPLLLYTEGPDGRRECTACGWVKGLCPYHKGFIAGATQPNPSDGASTWPTQPPRFELGQALLFAGRVPCTVLERAWTPPAACWTYLVRVGTDGAITSPESSFTADEGPST